MTARRSTRAAAVGLLALSGCGTSSSEDVDASGGVDDAGLSQNAGFRGGALSDTGVAEDTGSRTATDAGLVGAGEGPGEQEDGGRRRRA